MEPCARAAVVADATRVLASADDGDDEEVRKAAAAVVRLGVDGISLHRTIRAVAPTYAARRAALPGHATADGARRQRVVGHRRRTLTRRHVAVLRKHWPDGAFERHLRRVVAFVPDAATVDFFDGATYVGSAVLTAHEFAHAPSVVVLWSIATAKRRKGFGALMLNAIGAHCDEIVTLATSEARPFYEALGFREDDAASAMLFQITHDVGEVSFERDCVAMRAPTKGLAPRRRPPRPPRPPRALLAHSSTPASTSVVAATDHIAAHTSGGIAT